LECFVINIYSERATVGVGLVVRFMRGRIKLGARSDLVWRVLPACVKILLMLIKLLTTSWLILHVLARFLINDLDDLECDDVSQVFL